MAAIYTKKNKYITISLLEIVKKNNCFYVIIFFNVIKSFLLLQNNAKFICE